MFEEVSMTVGDKVTFLKNKENAGYKEYFGKIGTIIDEQYTKSREQKYIRVSFDKKQELPISYIDVGSWRITLAK